MKNPFEYGGIVRSDYFCNRTAELRDLKRAIENGDNLFIFSERRFGKSSLILRALSELPKKEYLQVYIDLWPTDGEGAFIAVFAKAVTEAFSTTPDKMLDFARGAFASLRPSVTVNSEGNAEIQFGVNKQNPSAYTMDEILDAPVKAAERLKKKVVVVFDEFQQVMEYESDIVERRLRSTIQKHDQVSYIFSGSRKHLIQKMVLDKTRPLYRAGGHYPLGPIALSHWQSYIGDRFSKSGRSISSDLIDLIFSLTQGHPFYTQALCHALWELAEQETPVSSQLIEQSIALLLRREDYAYTNLWDSLATNQRRLLEALASENERVKPFTGDFVRKYGMKTSSNVQRAITALIARDLIDQEEDGYFILDRFLRLWIQKRAGQWSYFMTKDMTS